MPSNRVLVPPELSSRLLTAAPEGELETISGVSMGTTWSVQAILGHRQINLRECIERALHRVIEQMSTWEPTSHLSQFNRAAPATWCKLPAECWHVLTYALWLARETKGAYDPTIGALSNLWGFGPSGPRAAPPSVTEIDAARARTGWHRIEVSTAERRAWQPGGIEIDLSSIAKGYAVDHVARALEAHGIANYLVEIGGELRGAGCKQDDSPWWVDIERIDPDDSTRTLVALHELSVATSGDYRRYMEADGTRYSHSIDPRTGWPIDNALASVTVLARECMHADALATALHILGPEQGLAFADAHSIAAVLVERRASGFVHHFSAAVQQYLD